MRNTMVGVCRIGCDVGQDFERVFITTFFDEIEDFLRSSVPGSLWASVGIIISRLENHRNAIQC
jgi:hypothetical protein